MSDASTPGVLSPQQGDNTPAVERIVAMTTRHVGLLMPFERDMFGAEAWTRGGYLAELADRTNRTYLAVEDPDGALLGWGGVRVLADEAEVLTVGIVPAARRRGLARRLLDALLAAAATAGARDVYLEVRVDNVPARTLYAAAGFDEVGVRRGYYENGRVDAVVMHLDAVVMHLDAVVTHLDDPPGGGS